MQIETRPARAVAAYDELSLLFELIPLTDPAIESQFMKRQPKKITPQGFLFSFFQSVFACRPHFFFEGKRSTYGERFHAQPIDARRGRPDRPRQRSAAAPVRRRRIRPRTGSESGELALACRHCSHRRDLDPADAERAGGKIGSPGDRRHPERRSRLADGGGQSPEIQRVGL